MPRNGSRPVEEGGDGHLVRGVVGARVGAASLARRAREREQRERLQVGRVELEGQARGEVERRNRRRGAFRVGERVGDRHAHVRVPEMGERCTVAEAHERVDDGRRVDDDLDPLVREPEQKMRLDQLEALVRERRRVDRDLRPHAPRRVGEGLLGRDVVELVSRSAAERAARGREDERVHLLIGAALQALKGRGVLAVHGEQPASSPLLRRQREVAGSDEALLVGEREVDAALERPERDGQAGEADDRVQDDIGLGPLEQLRQVAARLGERREAVDRRRAGCGGHELELGVGLDDLERLAADRAGGADQGDTLHGDSITGRFRSSSLVTFGFQTGTDCGDTIAAGRRLGSPERAKQDRSKAA